jgi:hypothetical protein
MEMLCCAVLLLLFAAPWLLCLLLCVLLLRFTFHSHCFCGHVCASAATVLVLMLFSS